MKKLLLCFGLAALLISGLCSAAPAESPDSDPTCGEELLASLFAPEPAAASSPPALEVQVGECCAREFAKCAARCECGVARFTCTLDFPGCTPSCTCRRCP